jgi:hypothetical protein
VKYGTAYGALQDPGVTPPSTEKSPIAIKVKRQETWAAAISLGQKTG